MPNWTTNEVTFSSAKTTNIKKIKDIFEKGCPFGQLIEEPNWDSVPLKGNETIKESYQLLNEKKSDNYNFAGYI